MSRQLHFKRMHVLPILGKPYSTHSVHSVIAMNERNAIGFISKTKKTPKEHENQIFNGPRHTTLFYNVDHKKIQAGFHVGRLQTHITNRLKHCNGIVPSERRRLLV